MYTRGWMCLQNTMICINCSKALNNNDVTLVDDTLHEILQVLFENSGIEIEIGCRICEDCNEKIRVAFQFKSMCVDTYDRLHPYTSRITNNGDKIDLKMVYMEQKKCKSPIVGYICRLCLVLVDKWNKHLLKNVLSQKNWEDKFHTYLPEINLELTDEPVICTSCLRSLEEFMNNILKVVPQKKTNNDYLENCQIKSEIDVESPQIVSIKMEYNNEDIQAECLNTEDILKSFEKVSARGLYRCKLCFKEYAFVNHMTKHMRTHTEVWFKCESCPYKSRYKMYLEFHKKSHDSNIQVLKCTFCSFHTKNVENLKRHELLHNYNEKRYKCDICLYRTCKPNYLKQHKERLHPDLSKVKLLTCDLCSYETRIPEYFDKHIFIHKNNLEKEMFTCYQCGKETRSKDYLRDHIELVHIKLQKSKLCSKKSTV